MGVWTKISALASFSKRIVIFTLDASVVGGVVDESSTAAALVALNGDDALCVLIVRVALSVNVARLVQSSRLCRLLEIKLIN